MPDEQERGGGITHEEREGIADRASPRAPVVYETVRHHGEDELARPITSLFWSGVAAGITMMASVIAEGALRRHIPADAAWRDVVTRLGYSFGFVIVILGRMQLFTEQTIVTVLPVVAEPSLRKLAVAARLWAVVFVANMVGTSLAAAILVFGHLQSGELLAAMLDVARENTAKPPLATMLQGIPAGFLVAAIAWTTAAITGGELAIIVGFTYAIALAGFSHVVVGSAEAFLLLFSGETGAAQTIAVIGPALAGNIVGGTGLFALLAHAQVRQEL